MAYEQLTQRRAGTGDLDTLARSSLQKRMTTGSPDLWAKFKEMDDATARAGQTVRSTGQQQAIQQAGLGQGLSARNANVAERTNMQQVANNKLKQAQMLGEDKVAATTQAFSQGNADASQRQNYLNMWLKNAGEIGDSTSAGAAQDLLLGEAGYDYTGASRNRMAGDARIAGQDEGQLRSGMDRNVALAEDQAAQARKKAERNRLLEGLSGLTSENPITALGALF